MDGGMHAVQAIPPYSLHTLKQSAWQAYKFSCLAWRLHKLYAQTRTRTGPANYLELTSHILVLQLQADTTTINSTHFIHRVSFGPTYPGQVNPLDGTSSEISLALSGIFPVLAIV